MNRYVTAEEKAQVESALTEAGFKNLTWDRDTIISPTRFKDKRMADILRPLGFYVPCSGAYDDKSYAQVWK